MPDSNDDYFGVGAKSAYFTTTIQQTPGTKDAWPNRHLEARTGVRDSTTEKAPAASIRLGPTTRTLSPSSRSSIILLRHLLPHTKPCG